MTIRPVKPGSAAAVRRAAATLKSIEDAVNARLGADEAARRIRRYLGDHDAPADDGVAFGRLCAVVFAQGLGFQTVEAKSDALREAFAGYDAGAVAHFDDADIARVLTAPIIRNESKVRACVENASRWIAIAAEHGSFLGGVAVVAADDDAAAGWPALAERMHLSFARIGETAARQALKRWGFFTAFAHPGSRRVLERLGMIAECASAADVQCFVGAVARSAGRDPYEVEACLALFASHGPCRPLPKCAGCELADRCPHGQANAA
jgi:DNA-3-methyladenine glycosylase I